VFPNVEGALERLGIPAAYARLSEPARARTTPAGMLQMFLLYRYGVATMDRASFGRIGAEGEHFLRLSIANDLTEIRRGIGLIATAIGDPDGFAAFLEEERLWG
jgi:hypothetical protein